MRFGRAGFNGENMSHAIKSFTSAEKFRAWLEKNHTRVEGIWLRMAKKGSGAKSVTYAEALDEALCHGWIDGQKKSLDERFWLQKFTPRRAASKWSKINTGHAERLIAEGRMAPAGRKQIEAAKADGRWATAYDSPGSAAVPGDFLAALKKLPKARAFFEKLSRTNVYAITYRLQTAKKPETREKRLKMILEMLARGEAFHP